MECRARVVTRRPTVQVPDDRYFEMHFGGARGPAGCRCQSPAVPVRCDASRHEETFVARPAHSAHHAQRPPARSPGQGEGYLRVRRSSVDRRHRPHLGVRLHPGSGIPDKGKVLTQISSFWFDRTRSIVKNHVLSTDPATYPPETREAAADLAGRSMLVTRTEPLAIECVARGYLSGSGWKDYAATGEVCGIRLPSGLRESERLPEPIFTPATKAQSGHDINISEDAGGRVGRRARARPGEGPDVAAVRARVGVRGVVRIIIADTKFEFGLLGAAPGGATSCSSTRRSRRTHPGSGRATGINPAGRSRVSTSSSSAITWSAFVGTNSPRSRRCPTRSSPEHETSTWRRFDASPDANCSERRPHRMISERLQKLVEEMVEKGVHFEDAVRELEKRFIVQVLGQCAGSLTKTAGALGIHRNTLTRKMGEYRIKRRAGR